MTTMPDMHLSRAAIESAIRLLEPPGASPRRRDIVETAGGEFAKRLSRKALGGVDDGT